MTYKYTDDMNDDELSDYMFNGGDEDTSEDTPLQSNEVDTGNDATPSQKKNDDETKSQVVPDFKYRCRSFAEMLKVPAPTEYIIDGQIQARALHYFFGEPGCGKTFCAIDMACSIACEDITDFKGLSLQHGSVVYFAGEGGEGLAKRFMGWCLSNNVNPENVKLYVMEEVFHLNESKDKKHSIENTIANIRAVCDKPKLVVIDTQARFLEGSENDSKDVSSFIDCCTKMIRELGTAVLVITHNGHATEAKGRIRGSSAIQGAADIVTECRNSGEHLTLDQTKHKDGQKISGLTLDMKEITLPKAWNKPDGTPSTTLTLNLSPYSRHDTPESQHPVNKKLTPAQKRRRTSYVEAAKRYGIRRKDEQSGAEIVAVHIEDWRKVAYELSTCDTPDAKQKQFTRDRRDLCEKDMSVFKREFEKGDYYCMDLEAKGDDAIRIAIIAALDARGGGGR